MNRISLFGFCLIAALTYPSSFLNADTLVYDNNAGGASGIQNAFLSDSTFPYILADDVVLSSTTNVTSVEWSGIYNNQTQFSDDLPGPTDNFTIAVFETNAGSPLGGSPVASFNVGNNVNRANSGQEIFGIDVFSFSANINFTMNANTTYWVSIENDTTGDIDFFSWGIEGTSAQPRNAYYSQDGGATWSSQGVRADFRLFGTVAIPEPSSFLALTVVAALSIAKRRR